MKACLEVNTVAVMEVRATMEHLAMEVIARQLLQPVTVLNSITVHTDMETNTIHHTRVMELDIQLLQVTGRLIQAMAMVVLDPVMATHMEPVIRHMVPSTVIHTEVTVQIMGEQPMVAGTVMVPHHQPMDLGMAALATALVYQIIANQVTEDMENR